MINAANIIERVVAGSGILRVLTVALTCLVAPGLAQDAPTVPAPAPTQDQEEEPSLFRSKEDGWFDVGGFLDTQFGFLPIVVPITEPAVGYGAAGGVAFLSRPLGEVREGFGRPNVTFVGGLATENGTEGLMAGDLRHWMDDRLQTLVAVADMSVNLDFFGVGADAGLDGHHLSYNLQPTGGFAQARLRLGESRAWAGLSYGLAAVAVDFDDPGGTTGLPEDSDDSTEAGLTPSLSFDSRDNMFTPVHGTYLEGSWGLFDEALGGDHEFQRAGLLGLQYFELDPDLYLGLRAELDATFGDAPFYLQPYIALRGAPAMRYQGEQTAVLESELRWRFWNRWSAIGFLGTGSAWNDMDQFDDKQSVVTGGTGFRYEIARDYRLHLGLDVAFGPDGAAVYVQVGSAWARP
jgi:hypothetical protein